MDRGEAFRQEMRIRPCGDGSFLVGLGVDRDFGRGSISEFAFTNVSDLLDWLVAHAKAFATNKIAADVTHELTEGDVVKEGPSLRERFDARYGTTLGNILDSGKGNLRRTSVAEKMFPGTGMSAADMHAMNARRAVAAGVTPEPPTAA